MGVVDEVFAVRSAELNCIDIIPKNIGAIRPLVISLVTRP
jgi:hypothetical protein